MTQDVGGLLQDLQFLPEIDHSPWQANPYYSDVRAEVQLLMMGWSEEIASQSSALATLKSLLFGVDKDWYSIKRHLFQVGFKHVFEQLQAMELTDAARAQAELYISNCLAFLSFTELNPYEFVSVPQWVNGEWKLVDYKVTPIELTPDWGLEKLFIRECDRLFAYGLEPIGCNDASPHLVFMGTAISGGQGVLPQIHTDLEAFETPGKRMYRFGRERIIQFLDKQVAQGKKTHVCGMSLGGALSLLVAIDQGNKLSHVDALNPPGLYAPFRKSQYDHWEEFVEAGTAPDVCVQREGVEPASQHGNWRKEFRLLHVQAPEGKGANDPFFDHVLNYAGLAGTTFTDIDPEADSKANGWRNSLYFIGLRCFLFYVFSVPIYYIIRPVVSAIWRHKIELGLIALPLILAPFINIGVLFALSLVATCAAMVIAFEFLSDFMHAVIGIVDQETLDAHLEDLPREPMMDLYTNKATVSFDKSLISMYQSRYGMFSDSELHEVSDDKVEITDSKARIYELEQLAHIMSDKDIQEEKKPALYDAEHTAYMKGAMSF